MPGRPRGGVGRRGSGKPPCREHEHRTSKGALNDRTSKGALKERSPAGPSGGDSRRRRDDGLRDVHIPHRELVAVGGTRHVWARSHRCFRGRRDRGAIAQGGRLRLGDRHALGAGLGRGFHLAPRPDTGQVQSRRGHLHGHEHRDAGRAGARARRSSTTRPPPVPSTTRAGPGCSAATARRRAGTPRLDTLAVGGPSGLSQRLGGPGPCGQHGGNQRQQRAHSQCPDCEQDDEAHRRDVD